MTSTLLTNFATSVGSYPICSFCKETARYYFAPKDGVSHLQMAYGCAEHYEEHRAFDTLGVGKAQVLYIPRPGARIGMKVNLLPFTKRPVYKPAFVLVLEEDAEGLKGLCMDNIGRPTNSTIFPYPRTLWRIA